MKNTNCALCGDNKNIEILHQENLPELGITSAEYAPRRERDFIHYRIVKCIKCGLVRSDPIANNDLIEKYYEKSDCTYTLQKENQPLKKTYGKYFEEMLREYSIQRSSYLDIGCSNGFMLENALELGFSNVMGIEPSLDAIKQASDKIKSKIIPGMFDPLKFKNQKFNVISFFQTFDHILDPNQFLQNVRKILDEDGYVIAINHNVGAISYKFLKEKSPIIDIGHAYLYDLSTMKKIFEKNHFKVMKVFPIKNIVSSSRLLELLPINEQLIGVFAQCQKKLGVESLQIPLYLGNLGIYAQKQ